MNKWAKSEVTGIRIVLGALFVYASLDKIFAPAEFANVIYNYRILPLELVNLCALIVPWIEFSLGICLLLGIWLETVSLILSVMTLVFIIMILTAILRGLDIQCGCFTLAKGGDRVSWQRIGEDIIILCGLVPIFLQALRGYRIKG